MQPMLPEVYDGRDVTGWWLSEKYDGVRAIWTGSVLLSKTGRRIHAPLEFTAGLPSGIPLDGELWMGRGSLQRLAGLLRRKIIDPAAWLGVKFMVFDAPEREGVLEERQGYISAVLDGCVAAEQVLQVPCAGPQHLFALRECVAACGGEGVIIRAILSPYVAGRSELMMKYKPGAHHEAVVVGYNPGAAGVSSLVVEWQGKTFALGCGLTNELRLTPPKIGASVTFYHEGLTDDGLPRSAVYITERDYE